MLSNATPSTHLNRAAPLALFCLALACSKNTPDTQEAAERSEPSLPAQPTAPASPRPTSMAAVQSTSKVLYVNEPEDPHRLRITLADSGFARLKLASDPEVQGRRVLQHMHAGKVYTTSARASESVELQDADALGTRNWFDLRTALYSWPGEKKWHTDPAQPHKRALPLRRGLSIIAEIDSGTGLPSSMGYYGKDGRGLQRFTHLVWSDEGLNSRILAFQVEGAKGVLWQESDIQVRRGLSMRGDFFLPTDRRPKSNLPITTRPVAK